MLEGGSIESDGMGTLLTTSECLLSPNRNGQLNKVEIEEYLRSTFHLERVLWLDYGYLAGDDTDSHIDTLARFCSPDTIAYVQCRDVNDEHYEELHRMEEQLKTFRTLAGEPYRLLALPMADKIEAEGERLPATYANFLIMNDAVLYPTKNEINNFHTFLLSDYSYRILHRDTMQRTMLFYQSTAVYTYNFMLGKSHLQHLFGTHIILRLVICGI